LEVEIGVNVVGTYVPPVELLQLQSLVLLHVDDARVGMRQLQPAGIGHSESAVQHDLVISQLLDDVNDVEVLMEPLPTLLNQPRVRALRQLKAGTAADEGLFQAAEAVAETRYLEAAEPAPEVDAAKVEELATAHPDHAMPRYLVVDGVVNVCYLDTWVLTKGLYDHKCL
jgi:hypothetical protein